jgi:hypothetical protein
MKPDVLAERLMLAIYGYGTNTGIRAVIPAGGAHTEEDVRYVRRRYLSPAVAQALAVGIANATFAARDTGLWGNASTAVASDSTRFRTWDQNLFTEWHARYGGGGVLVYWHLEDRYVVVHSQVLKASASEVAAMVEGAVRHGTTTLLGSSGRQRQVRTRAAQPWRALALTGSGIAGRGIPDIWTMGARESGIRPIRWAGLAAVGSAVLLGAEPGAGRGLPVAGPARRSGWLRRWPGTGGGSRRRRRSCRWCS